MTNKKDGLRFERRLCDILHRNGFWVHNIAQNHAGQPFDIIASKNNRAVIMDAKVCKNDRFPLSRIEENQRYAMNLWLKTGNSKAWFALELADGDIFMMDYKYLQNWEKASLNEDDIIYYGVLLNSWLEDYT